ncbi:MAG: chromosome segregation protein SMC [Opitutales bacterium]
MHLKQVVINGFKSFADRTKLDLEPGVIAIVGPNGCGKSNTADAIRWVLGEQSAKAMRGSKMQDVIFAGSEKRKALNLCEVFLTFTNCEEKLGTAFNEVEVGRRVSREGSSDYFINGKVCRLKDIQRLFMDTGVGRVSYSFLLQGQIDQILSSNPSERRVIFEEAAGITKYKAQRRETLNKLNLVEANLTRVTDVIEEVGRQIGSLKRQASKAIRYKRIKHRVTHLDLAQMSKLWSGLDADRAELEKAEANFSESLNSARSALSSEESVLEEMRTERAALYEGVQVAQQNVFNLRSELESSLSKAEFARVRQKDVTERLDKIDGEIQRYAEQLKELNERLQNESNTRQMQLDIVGDSDTLFQDRNRDVLIAQEQLTKAERDLQERRQHLLVLESKLTRLRSNATTLEVELKTYEVRHAELSEQAFTLREETAGIEANLEEVVSTLETRQERRDAEQAALESLTSQRKQTIQEARAKQSEAQETDKTIARTTAQLNVLEKLNNAFEGFGAGAKAILQGKLSDVVDPDSVGLLAKNLQVAEENRVPFEALLGANLDALVLEDKQTLEDVIAALSEKKLGRATMRAGGVRSIAYNTPSDLPDGVVSALEIVDSDMSEHVRAVLGGCYVAQNLESFITYWEAHPEFRFSKVATPEGTILGADGTYQGGRGKGSDASILQRQNEIRSLKETLEGLHQKVAVQRDEVEALQDKVQAIEKEIEEKRGLISEIIQEVSTLKAQQRAAQQEQQKNAIAREKAEGELADFEEQNARQRESLETARIELGKGEEELRNHRDSIEAGEKAVVSFREERDARRDSLADLRLQLAEKRQRLESLDKAMQQIGQQRDLTESTLRRREQERDTLIEQGQELRDEEGNMVARHKQIQETLEVTAGELEVQRERFQGLESRVKQAEQVITEKRRTERDTESQFNKIEVKLVECRSKLGTLSERAQTEYEVDLGRIDWKWQLWKADEEFEKRVDLDSMEDGDPLDAQPKEDRGDPTPEDLEAMDSTDWAEIDSEVKALKSRISSMGPVNLVAIQEYADLSERYTFLKEQSDDLWNSKNSLVQAIDEINTVSQQLFEDTFEQITKNFKYTYDRLTGGGFADLKLVDEGDVLDSGIEITAKPPGTRLKSLSLLSGGQKTMTAVALLFAIYMVKPSPFCVLDELDAPLDDANIGRFTEMLKSFTKYSQFVIITHNKRTIAASNVVYGVTMPEKGVSKVISMRFNKDENANDLEPAKAIGEV